MHRELIIPVRYVSQKLKFVLPTIIPTDKGNLSLYISLLKEGIIETFLKKHFPTMSFMFACNVSDTSFLRR